MRRHCQRASKIGLAALLVWSLTSCGEPAPAPNPDTKVSQQAPITRIRATLVLEPPRLLVGEVASAQITVVTPPDHRLLPVQPPDVDGVWLLDSIALETQRSELRWVHRTRVRLRARDVGPLLWPAFEVEVEDAAGAVHSIQIGERMFEIASVLGDFPDQTTPFGLRTAEASSGGGGFWRGVSAGVAAMLALAGLAFAFLWVRDRVPVESEATRRDEREREITLWDWADSGLAAAAAALNTPEGPRAAANQAARLLRQYVARRFNLSTEALTTEELSATKPPLAIDSRWPELLRILRRFDAERFQRSQLDEAAGERIRGEIEAVKRFVNDSIPPELRR